MRTSCAFGGATSTSSIENGLLASHITAALHLITCKQSKEKGNGTCICKSPHSFLHFYMWNSCSYLEEERENYRKKTQTNNAIKKPTPKHSVSTFFPAPRSCLTLFTFLSYKVFSNIYNSLLGYLDTLSIRIAPLFLSSSVANIIQVHKLFFVSNFLGGLFFLCWIACEYSYLLGDSTLNDVIYQVVIKSVLPRTACVGNSQNC